MRSLSTLFSALALAGVLSSNAAALQYRVYVPIPGLDLLPESGGNPGTNEPGPVVLKLNSGSLSPATKGVPYSFDFLSLLSIAGPGASSFDPLTVSWSVSSGALPAGLSLTGSVLSGTPAAKTAATSFQISASGQSQAYSLAVTVPLLYASQVSVGGYNTCVITPAGQPMCSGYNYNGGIGDGSTETRYSFVPVSGLSSGVRSITTAGYVTCAVMTTGTVKCWGNNYDQQLGITGAENVTYPTDVPGISGVQSLGFGGTHICGVTTSGAAVCWGSNYFGQAGNGGTWTQRSPAVVTGLGSGVAAVSAGNAHTCALTTSGGVKCWGYNAGGQLGDGTLTSSTSPVDVVGLTSGVVSIHAKGNNTCALLAGGRAVCWGDNSYGALGVGHTNTQPIPVEPQGMGSGVTAISPGDGFVCALKSGSGAQCWGMNNLGQLGVGDRENRSTPHPVLGNTVDILTLDTGTLHTCGRTTSNTVKCWGDGSMGQLGNEDRSSLESADELPAP